MRVDRLHAKRPRRTFTDEFKIAAVQNYEADRTLSLANASRLHDIDVKLMRNWIAEHGTGIRAHKAHARKAPVALKPATLGPDPDRPHRPRIRKFLATKPRSFDATDRAELAWRISEMVSSTLHEEPVDGEELLAELANQNHRVMQHWPSRFYTLKLFERQLSPQSRRPNAKYNPWGASL